MKAEDKIAKIQNIIVILVNTKRAYELLRQHSFDTHPNIIKAELDFMWTINEAIDFFGELIQKIRSGGSFGVYPVPTREEVKPTTDVKINIMSATGYISEAAKAAVAEEIISIINAGNKDKIEK